VITENNRGFWSAVLCYAIWGAVPIYWKLIKHIPAPELIAHRVIWSSVFCILLTLLLKNHKTVILTLKKSLWTLIVTTLLVSSNWLIFVWAVNEDRIMETSLGYYMNPILNILFGALILKEKLSKLQISSAILATIGVSYLLVTAGFFPWVSVSLAFTFALYGMIRKVAPVDPLAGLTLEATLMVPASLIYTFYLTHEGQGHFGSSIYESLMMIGGGVITLGPLLLFLYSIKRVHLSTMGFLQFITPTTTFLLAVFYYKEPMNLDKLMTFIFIWIAVLLYLLDLKLKKTKHTVTLRQN
jgi:chloramphenicol-sensitive protein RarD